MHLFVLPIVLGVSGLALSSIGAASALRSRAGYGGQSRSSSVPSARPHCERRRGPSGCFKRKLYTFRLASLAFPSGTLNSFGRSPTKPRAILSAPPLLVTCSGEGCSARGLAPDGLHPSIDPGLFLRGSTDPIVGCRRGSFGASCTEEAEPPPAVRRGDWTTSIKVAAWRHCHRCG